MHNSERWRDQLPKSNYLIESFEEEKDNRGKYQNLSHEKLKEIVRQKKE